ncbi:MAG: hypothetical protein K1000chlam2_00047 [Chlamydiae bacterium]|nr:hypothetical protein [Chlamydiota bacterium]
MQIEEQLTFWDEPLTQETLMWKEIHTLKERQGCLRRGLFQRHDQLKKDLKDLKDTVSELKCLLKLEPKTKVVEYDFISHAHG